MRVVVALAILVVVGGCKIADDVGRAITMPWRIAEADIQATKANTEAMKVQNAQAILAAADQFAQGYGPVGTAEYNAAFDLFVAQVGMELGLRPNAYGPSIHQNQYGQAVTVRPDHGGVPGEQLQLKENAYGPGVHMDQYGRPVREYSWPDGKPVQ